MLLENRLFFTWGKVEGTTSVQVAISVTGHNFPDIVFGIVKGCCTGGNVIKRCFYTECRAK